MSLDASKSTPIVQSNNEWDPLEEVIVGILDGAAYPTWEIGYEAVTAVEHLERSRKFLLQSAGKPLSQLSLIKASKELENFVDVLKREGVTVRRPECIAHDRPILTPQWSTPGGNCQANPRDVLIVFDNEILEAPMAWRSRYFEFWAYRRLVKEYFKAGAQWTTAPKPELSDATYDYNWVRSESYVTREYEPTFDVADISRCGRDLFVQRSHVTNDFGIEWLRRHLEPRGYRIHRLEFEDYRALHIDATFVPLAPGKLLLNPDRPMKAIPAVLKNSDWELREAPRSTLPVSHPSYHSFKWLSMNMLSLDDKRVIVEQEEGPMHDFLADWGFEPIAVPFRNNYSFGGSFHCATVDIRRRGSLQDYF